MYEKKIRIQNLYLSSTRLLPTTTTTITTTTTTIIIIKARYQGTTENSCIGHSTHTAECANVEAQRSLILKTALYAPLTVRAE
jgi:hypothetical protein